MGKVLLPSEVQQDEVVPETEVETLVMRDSERILKESGNPRLNFNPGPDMVHTEIRHGTDILVAQNPLILGGGIKKNSSSSNNTPQNINSTTRSGNQSGNQSTTAERRKK